MARRDDGRGLPPVARPDREPGEARLAVDGEEVEVVVEARQDRPRAHGLRRLARLLERRRVCGHLGELREARARRRQEVGRRLHALPERVLLQPEAERRHLRDGLRGGHELLAPRVHRRPPLVGERVGHDGRRVQLLELGRLRARADAPEEAPLRVRDGRALGQRAVLEVLHHVALVPRLLDARGRHADLVVQMRPRVRRAVRLLEVPLHHIEERLVVRVVDARVFYDEAAVRVERVRYFPARGVVAVAGFDERRDVDDRDFGHGESVLRDAARRRIGPVASRVAAVRGCLELGPSGATDARSRRVGGVPKQAADSAAATRARALA
mmetsp:Transcript_22801/g.70520  ORF Transcript_22801/g.70520 Transcript_22801/m.70520 type:complete len:326 (-) Transcript_22801:80-1057(-)